MMTTQYNQIAATIVELNLVLTTTTTPTPCGKRSPPAADERDKLHRRVKQLQTVMKGKWVAGRF